MKKTASVICMVLCLLLIAGQSAFATGLEITDIVPKNGESGRQVQNMAVKLTFSENMMDEAAIEKNTSLFKITDPEGTEVPFKLAYSEEKYPDQLWLIIEGALNANTEYTVTVHPGVRSAAGSSLGGMFGSIRTTSGVCCAARKRKSRQRNNDKTGVNPVSFFRKAWNYAY